jgi:putative DNA-invertase from lambdoid prophage Rac
MTVRLFPPGTRGKKFWLAWGRHRGKMVERSTGCVDEEEAKAWLARFSELADNSGELPRPASPSRLPPPPRRASAPEVAPTYATGRCFGYARVSTKEQALHGYSLDAQREAILGYAQQHQLGTPRCFVDAGVSGGLAWELRPEGRRLLELLAAGDCVIATKFDRVFRDEADGIETTAHFHRRGVVFHFVDLGGQYAPHAVGKLTVAVLAAIAADERRKIRERVRSGKRFAAAVGYYLGGRVPIGYQTDAEGRPMLDAEGKLIEDPLAQRSIALVHELHRRGHSLRAIQRHLAKEGVGWSRGTIHNIIRGR